MKAMIDGTIVRTNTIWKSDHDEYVVITDIDDKEFGIYIRFLDTGQIRWCDDRAFLRSFYEIEVKE